MIEDGQSRHRALYTSSGSLGLITENKNEVIWELPVTFGPTFRPNVVGSKST